MFNLQCISISLKPCRFVDWTGTIKPPLHGMKRNFNRIDNKIPQNEDKQKLLFQNWKYTRLKLLWNSVSVLKFLECIYGPFKKLTTGTREKEWHEYLHVLAFSSPQPVAALPEATFPILQSYPKFKKVFPALLNHIQIARKVHRLSTWLFVHVMFALQNLQAKWHVRLPPSIPRRRKVMTHDSEIFIVQPQTNT